MTARTSFPDTLSLTGTLGRLSGVRPVVIRRAWEGRGPAPRFTSASGADRCRGQAALLLADLQRLDLPIAPRLTHPAPAHLQPHCGEPPALVTEHQLTRYLHRPLPTA